MKRKCIYLYADILGYKDLLKNQSVNEVRNIMRSCLIEIQTIINNKEDDSHKRNIRYYFAFDTIVILWDDLSTDRKLLDNELDIFLNLVSKIYLNLYINHDILIRGAISISSDYYIDNEIFIIKDIENAYQVEKNQDWGNIILINDELLYSGGICMPSDDTYAALELQEIPFKNNFISSILKNEEDSPIQANEIFHTSTWNGNLEPKHKIFVLNPINNTTYNYLNNYKLLEILENKITQKLELNINEDLGIKKKYLSANKKQYLSAKYLKERIKEYKEAVEREKTWLIK